MEIKMAVINSLQAYVKALSSGFPPFNYANAAAVLLTARQQIQLIKNEQPPSDLLISPTGGNTTTPPAQNDYTPPRDNSQIHESKKEFRYGGMIARGARHSQGGIQLWDQGKRYLGEMEDGEYIGIFSREVTRKHGPLLRALTNSNLIQQGKPIYAAEGVFGGAYMTGSYEGDTAAAYNMAVASTNAMTSNAEISANMLSVLGENKLLLSNMQQLLSNIAGTNQQIANKNFSVSINNIIQQSEVKARVDSLSNFG